jgi:NADH-quinone oxidoreductase subunit H
VNFILKVVLLCWLQLQIRWSLPRFRYDQIMKLCWQYMLPLALVNVFITGMVLLLIGG